MKIVAVSQRVESNPGRNEICDVLDQRLCKWLSDAGCLPVPIPNSLPPQLSSGHTLSAWLEKIRPDAAVLSGGNDIGEVQERDETEKQLLNYAKSTRLPVLGICRGMQMLGLWSDGKLMTVQGHVRSRHELHSDESGWPVNVNSFHSSVLAACPAGFSVKARTEDGVIEAMRHQELPWEGWMWHPEREPEFNSIDQQRLNQLFDL